MTHNVGTADKVIRVIIGLALLSLLYFLPGGAKWWGLIGLIPLATVFMSWCPLYSIIGTSTAGKKA